MIVKTKPKKQEKPRRRKHVRQDTLPVESNIPIPQRMNHAANLRKLGIGDSYSFENDFQSDQTIRSSLSNSAKFVGIAIKVRKLRLGDPGFRPNSWRVWRVASVEDSQ